jgi:hypothetical protein
MIRSFAHTIAAIVVLGTCQLASAQSLKTSDTILKAPTDGTCYDTGHEFVSFPSPLTRTSSAISLSVGTYRPVLNGTSWRFSKTREFSDFGNYYFGEVVLEIVRVEVFGAESVVSRWSRAVDQHATGSGAAEAEFGTFTVNESESNMATFKLRVTVKTSSCARTAVRDVRVDLVKVS